MTDRAQPGAIDSVIRNDELAQVFDKFTEGFVVPAAEPTAAAQRRPDIDETALDEFRLSGVSAGSLTVTVEPGEAFIGGWMCRDTPTTVSLPANDTARIVAGYSTNAIFDPQVDADRDDADKAFIQLQRNTDPEFPQSVIHRVTTDGTGVIDDERVAAVGAQVSVDNLIIDSVNSITDATPRPGRIKIAQKTDPGGNEIFEFTNATDNIRSSPTVVDGIVYVGSFDSSLYAIDAATGNEIFEFTNATGTIPCMRSMPPPGMKSLSLRMPPAPSSRRRRWLMASCTSAALTVPCMRSMPSPERHNCMSAMNLGSSRFIRGQRRTHASSAQH